MAVEQHGVEMSDAEIAAFLESHGVGTLAFGNDEGAYAIPMSFGYDREQDICYFQFAFGDDSRKQQYLEEDKRVSLCVFEWNDELDWKSVLLEGDINDIEEDRSPRAASVFAAYAKLATLEIFDAPLEEMDLSWYMLYIKEKHGRQATN